MENANENLSELFKIYISEKQFSQRLRPATLKGYRDSFNLFLRIMPQVTSIDSLTSNTLNEFFKRIETRQRIIGKGEIREGVKSSTIKTYWSKLNVFFSWLCHKNYLDLNPLDEVECPRVSYDDFKRLTDEQLRKVYTAVMLHSPTVFLLKRNTVIISLLLYCGLRRGELVSLQVINIDFEKKLLTVVGKTSKSKFTRIVPINDTLIMHLKDYLKERKNLKLTTEYLLASSRGDRELTLDGLNHWIKSIIKASGVKFHAHQLRHTYACKLAEIGTSAFVIQKLMGHTDIRMTSKYTRSLNSQDMRDFVNKISI